ncbi:MAG: DoxX family protein [Patescibacteria group bacterium]
MLNPFPELLDFGILAPTLIRVAVAVFFINFGWNKLTKEREHKATFFESIGLRPAGVYVTLLGIFQIVAGVCLIVGVFTQVFAIICATIALVSYIIKKRHPEMLFTPSSIYALLFIMALSLVFSGAGLPAVDLPL